jgi:hypothetical protein
MCYPPLQNMLSKFYKWGLGLRRCATSRTVLGSIPGGVTSDFFRGSFRQSHVSWGRLSLWKWVPGISPGVKAAGAFGWRSTTLVVTKVENMRGLNLPGTPRGTSACRGIALLYFLSFLNFVTNLKFAIFNIQMKNKCYRWKRDLVRYQRLNIAYCSVASNRIYDQPDDGLETKGRNM